MAMLEEEFIALWKEVSHIQSGSHQLLIIIDGIKSY